MLSPLWTSVCYLANKDSQWGSKEMCRECPDSARSIEGSVVIALVSLSQEDCLSVQEQPERHRLCLTEHFMWMLVWKRWGVFLIPAFTKPDSSLCLRDIWAILTICTSDSVCLDMFVRCHCPQRHHNVFSQSTSQDFLSMFCLVLWRCLENGSG